MHYICCLVFFLFFQAEDETTTARITLKKGLEFFFTCSRTLENRNTGGGKPYSTRNVNQRPIIPFRDRMSSLLCRHLSRSARNRLTQANDVVLERLANAKPFQALARRQGCFQRTSVYSQLLHFHSEICIRGKTRRWVGDRSTGVISSIRKQRKVLGQ